MHGVSEDCGQILIAMATISPYLWDCRDFWRWLEIWFNELAHVYRCPQLCAQQEHSAEFALYEQQINRKWRGDKAALRQFHSLPLQVVGHRAVAEIEAMEI